MQTVHQKSEAIQASLSYASGGGTVALAALTDIANYAQQIGIILGCVVVMIRLAYDMLGLWHRLKKGSGK